MRLFRRRECSLGSLLEDWREMKGLSRGEVSHLSGLPVELIRRIEKDAALPTDLVLERLALAYGLRFEELKSTRDISAPSYLASAAIIFLSICSVVFSFLPSGARGGARR